MTITITQPDDWHVHFRDGAMLKRVAPFTANQFGRALIMPNLIPAISTAEQGIEYRKRILSALPSDSVFDPKMSIYLTDETPVVEVKNVSKSEYTLGFKLYPAGTTTNSSSGVTKITGRMAIFEAMAKHNVVLQVHGEVTDPNVDIFDRETVFIDQVLIPLHKEIPELKIVLEHITTSHGVDFVKSTNHMVAATITPQHLCFNRNELFKDGIQPHLFCLPVLKRESHRLALVEAATSGNPSFFLGTDSAPHTRSSKQSECGCAGIFSANAAIEIYAEVFDTSNAIDKLEGFASQYGADFYNLDPNPRKVTLGRTSKQIPERIGSGEDPDDGDLVPLFAGKSLSWTLVDGKTTKD